MTTPMPNIQPAVQTVQQQIQKPEATPKTEPSLFDKTLAQKAESTTGVSAAPQVAASQKVEQVAQIQLPALNKIRRSKFLQRVDPSTALSSTNKLGDTIEHVLSKLDSRNSSMEDFINKAIKGQLNLSDQQLLGLQAKVSQYSLELDLTSKVVEKATTGIKETLRTQV